MGVGCGSTGGGTPTSGSTAGDAGSGGKPWDSGSHATDASADAGGANDAAVHESGVADSSAADAGRVADGANDALADSAQGADAGTDGDAGSPIGWTSYTTTIVSSTPSTLSGDSNTTWPSDGYVGRFDVSADGLHAIVQPRFGDGSTFGAAIAVDATTPYDFVAAWAAPWPPWLRLSPLDGKAVYAPLDDYNTFSVSLSSPGSGGTSTWTGLRGDGMTSAPLTASVTFAPDTTAPVWRGSAKAEFASTPLPWDTRTLETSECYEESPAIDAMLGASASSVFAVERLLYSQWGAAPKERGLTFRTSDWDGAPTLAASAAPVHDLAGNVTAAGTPVPFGGIAVASHGAAILTFDDGRPAPFAWSTGMGGGSASVVSTGCESATRCGLLAYTYSEAIGLEYRGSAAGFATRLSGSGQTVALRVSATAVNTIPGQLPAPSGPQLYVRVTNPGSAPVVLGLPVATMSGWTTFTVSPPDPTASETAIDLSLGGEGPLWIGPLYPLVEGAWLIQVTIDSLAVEK
jgi:hypothetical protein